MMSVGQKEGESPQTCMYKAQNGDLGTADVAQLFREYRKVLETWIML